MAGDMTTAMSTSDRTFERIEALYDVRSLASKRVLIAGCGSGGGSVALQLVMSGVQHFTLVDNDVLGVENVIRHVCGLRFVGQRKVDGLAEVLADRNPKVQITKIFGDVMACREAENAIRESDIVILATDNETSRYKVNEFCVRNGVPFVVGRVFTRGIGGEAFRYMPSGGACLACLEAFLERSSLRQNVREIDLISDEERDAIYGLDVAEIKDSPGLCTDISFICSIHSRLALDILARQITPPPKYFIPIEENYIVWGNRPVHPFNRHFQVQRMMLDPQESCAVCSRDMTNV